MSYFDDLQQQALSEINQTTSSSQIAEIKNKYIGKKGFIDEQFQTLRKQEDPKQVGLAFNQARQAIQQAIEEQEQHLFQQHSQNQWIDVTAPGIKPDTGHLHLITQTIEQITDIFKRIGFIRVRYPEIETDWYAAEGLNIPRNHPARDEQETYYIKTTQQTDDSVDVLSDIGLTPHTSSGQLREMERILKLSTSEKLTPVRMINISKCYRRQADVSHTSMFHQFEGLVINKDISIAHLKGTIDYFAKQFFGPQITSRLRPYNFRFTEPSFEVDFTCTNCLGKGCRLCKAGWLEVGGTGMVHPTVLKNGGIDPDQYSGFAFGWGIERVTAIKHNIPDIRLFYNTDIRFLSQF